MFQHSSPRESPVKELIVGGNWLVVGEKNNKNHQTSNITALLTQTKSSIGKSYVGNIRPSLSWSIKDQFSQKVRAIEFQFEIVL